MRTENVTRTVGIWSVFLFDCNCHTYMEAIEQIMFALNCTEHTSGQDTDMTQKFGSVAVYTGARDNCERVEVSLVMRG